VIKFTKIRKTFEKIRKGGENMLISKSASARYLSISVPTFDKRLNAGWFDGFVTVHYEGSRKRFNTDDLDSYLNAIRNAA